MAEKRYLVLSSEWEYSPFADPSVIDQIPKYVFVGLPVMEAGNSLIIPLAGHELGHSVWRQRKLDEAILEEIDSDLLEFLCANEQRTRDRIPEIPEGNDLRQQLRNLDWDWRETDWGAFARETTQSICEEMFCDFVGVRIFGSGFLYAFEYLIAPNIGATDLASYPKLQDRASHLLYAARQESCEEPELPEDYVSRFGEPSALSDEDHLAYSELELFLLDACHDTSKKMASGLLEHARTICEPLPRPTAALTREARKRLEFGVPATGMKAVRPGQRELLPGSGKPPVDAEEAQSYPTDVVNAGWLAYLDEELWKGKPAWQKKKFEIINELVFKSLDVMEFEERTRDAPQG